MSCEDRQFGKDATETPSAPPVTRLWTPNDLNESLVYWVNQDSIADYETTLDDPTDSVKPLKNTVRLSTDENGLNYVPGANFAQVKKSIYPMSSNLDDPNPPEVKTATVGNRPDTKILVFDENENGTALTKQVRAPGAANTIFGNNQYEEGNYYNCSDGTQIFGGLRDVLVMTVTVNPSTYVDSINQEENFGVVLGHGALASGESGQTVEFDGGHLHFGVNYDNNSVGVYFSAGARNIFNEKVITTLNSTIPELDFGTKARISAGMLRMSTETTGISVPANHIGTFIDGRQLDVRPFEDIVAYVRTGLSAPFETTLGAYKIKSGPPEFDPDPEEITRQFTPQSSAVTEIVYVKAVEENYWSSVCAGGTDQLGPRLVLNDEIRNKLEGYFAHKYQIASQLPQDHPYRFSPPTVIVEDESQQQSLGVTETGPFDVLGYYPLYRTKQAARDASPTPEEARTVEERQRGLVGFHIHVLNGVEYYMPNGLDAIGQQFHGDYGIQTDVQNEESLKTGIDSIDQQRDNKNYRYIGFYNGSTISSSDLNEFQQNIREGFSFLGEVGFSWPYYNGSQSENMRVGGGHWNGATPLFPDRIALGGGVGNYTERTITQQNPLSVSEDTNNINVTFLESDYFSVDKTTGGDGLRYPVRLSYALTNESAFTLSIPKLNSGRTIVGLNMLQREIDSNQDPSFKPKRSKSLGPTRIQINFSGADFVDSVNLEDTENFAPVFYIDHLNKEIRYMNNLLITKIT